MIALLPYAFEVGSLLGLLFLLALYHVYGYTLYAWLHSLANMFRSVRTPSILGHHLSLGFLGDAVDAINNDARHALGKGVQFFEAGFHYSMHAAAWLTSALGDALADLADTTLQRFQHVTSVTIPHWVTVRLTHVARRLDALEHEINALPHRAEIVIRKPVQVIRTEVVKAGHAAVAIPRPRLGRLEHDAEALAGRIGRLGREANAEAAKLTRLNKATIGAAAVALVAVAMAKLGLGFLRCSNTRKAAKHLCGMDTSLLDTLLADTLLIVGTVSLVEFAKGMQDAIGEIEQPIRHFWRAA